MNILEIIEKKRDKKELTKQEIEYFIKNYVNEKISDYQAAALTMAIFLNGMTKQETTNLTMAMAHSGEILDLSNIKKTIVDKHSTGGVGDKVSICLLPLVASIRSTSCQNVWKRTRIHRRNSRQNAIDTRIQNRYRYTQIYTKCGKHRNKYDFTNNESSTSR